MGIEFEDVLKADLVLIGFGLLSTPGEFEEFRSAVGTDATVAGHGMTIDAQTNVAEQGRAISLNRDRIILEIFPSRSTIRREYPTNAGDLLRLAEVAWQAISNTRNREIGLRAYGYNLDLVYSQDSEPLAQEYLASRLFSNDLPLREEWQLMGGAGRIIYREGENQWQFTLEPRFNDAATSRIFLTVNLHKDKQEIPSESEMNESLEEVWQQARKFAMLLDGSGV